MIGRALAYVLFSIPAAIGIWFIADYAFATSDDGWSAAFQLGLIAATAYAGPALALAVAGNGRKFAAFLLGILALGAMFANWSQTLDALANRGAGKEADQAKLSATVRTDRARLERIERERATLPNVSATDETVRAAQAAVTAAERIRIAECGNGDPKQRGLNCRTRESEEQAKRDALVRVLDNKATADKAAKLDHEIAAISARLLKAPAVKETSTGKTLGSLLSLSAVSAATFQQQFFSAIVELAIAASLALPELLRPKRSPATIGNVGAPGKREEEAAASAEIVAPETPKPRLVSDQTPAFSVADFVAERIIACRGAKIAFRDVYLDYEAMAQQQTRPALAPDQFAASLAKLCEATSVSVREVGGTVYLINVRFAHQKSVATKKKGLGPMARKHGESA
jgi:hypothetical protein